MADILNRLLLETKDFDAKLSNSKRGIGDYQSRVTNMAKTAGAGILKFAGAVGIAIGASEVFTKTVNSTQTTGDAWVKMQDQMKASVDGFFASIAMGDFSGFLSNLQNIIDKAGDLSVAFDDLGTKTLFNNSEVNDLNAKYQIEVNAAKARNISDKERNGHLSKAKDYLVQMSELHKSLAGANIQTSYVALQADITKQGFNKNVSKEVWEYLLKDSNRADVNKHAAVYDDKIKDYNSRIVRSRKFDAHTETMVDTPETYNLQQELLAYKNNPQNDFNRMTSVFIQLADDEKSAIAKAMQMRATANSLAVTISQKQLEIANVDAKVNGSYNSQTGDSKKGIKDVKKEIPIGSIAEIDAELSELNKELINATTLQARTSVQTTINELENKKIVLKMDVEKGVFAQEHGANKLSKTSNSEMAGVINSGSNKTLGSKKVNVKGINKIKSPVAKKDVDVLDDYQERLYNISDIMSSMSGLMGENAASWLNWGASLLSSIAQAIPAIESLIPALTAKAAGEAIAGSAASSPLGWLTAGAAVASILAAFASIPAFATGGIIEGGSTFGDMNLARVNAGEMVLNKMQQGNLFRLLDSGGSVPIQSSGVITVRVKGKDLVGVLSNYNSQKNRVR